MRCERERAAVYGKCSPGIRVLRLTNARKAKNTTLRPLIWHIGATLERLERSSGRWNGREHLPCPKTERRLSCGVRSGPMRRFRL